MEKMRNGGGDNERKGKTRGSNGERQKEKRSGR